MSCIAEARKLLACGALSAMLCGLARCDEPSGPLAPAEEQRTLQLADDRLMVELVAAEPQVIDPVACAWDEDGRLFVAEMRDYPIGPAGGTIRVLLDHDGDGRYEAAQIFAEGLAFPNSVLPYRGGLFVTAAPDVLFLKDTNGDGHADERRVVLTGLVEGNQQLRANGLTWGGDGWIYVANGRSDGEVRRPSDPPDKAVSIRRHDFRFHPETAEVQPLAGFSQFGLARDDWGNRFLSWNTIPMRHAVLELRDVQRNAHLLAVDTVAQILDPTDTSRVFPISRPPRTFNRESVQHFNASCGLTIFRGDALPPEYYGNALVCEPLTNLIHRRVLTPNGSTFLAKRPQNEQQCEFLASSDPWFRPVNLTTGPDGALYVVDFYREWVEHPQFVAEGLRDDVDFRVGDDRGRIWRIRSKNSPQAKPRIKLSQATIAELVGMLRNKSGWWRDTAERLLVERNDRAAHDALLAPDSAVFDKRVGSAGRVSALNCLAQLGGVPDEVLVQLLHDADALAREAAAKLAADAISSNESVAQAVASLAEDDDPRVRLAAAIALGNSASRATSAAMTKLASRADGDTWLRLAVLSGLTARETVVLAEVCGQPSTDASLIVDLAEMAGRNGNETQANECLKLMRDERKPTTSRLAVAVGLLRAADEETARDLGATNESLMAVAQRVIHDQATPSVQRLLAIELLTRAGLAQHDWLLRLLDASQSAEVTSAAVQAIGRADDLELTRRAIARWAQMSLSARRQLLSALVRPKSAEVVIEALEEGLLASTDIDTSLRSTLRAVLPAELRDRLETLLPSPDVDRVQVVAQFAEAARMTGDPSRGGRLFVEHCLTCHRVQAWGQRVGPDLSAIGSRPAAMLLVDLLDPGREIAPDYANFVIETDEGEILTGLLAGETAAAFLLKAAGGTETLVPRERIVRLQPAGASLMPIGFEQKLDLQGVADLLSFLREPKAELLRDGTR